MTCWVPATFFDVLHSSLLLHGIPPLTSSQRSRPWSSAGHWQLQCQSSWIGFQRLRTPTWRCPCIWRIHPFSLTVFFPKIAECSENGCGAFFVWTSCGVSPNFDQIHSALLVEISAVSGALGWIDKDLWSTKVTLTPQWFVSRPKMEDAAAAGCWGAMG